VDGLVLGLLVIGLYLTFIGQALSAYIERHYHTNRWDTPGAIFLSIFLFGGLIGIAYFEWYLAKKWGLTCPHCGELFIKHRSRRVALLRGDCSKCKKNIFDEDNLSGSKIYYNLNRDDFNEKLAKFTRRSNRREIRLLVFVFAMMIALVPAAKYFQRLVDDGRLDWVTLTEWRWVAGLVAGLILSALLLPFLYVPIIAVTGKFKLRSLPCPECGRALAGAAGRVAVDKGMCIYCGCSLFEAPRSKS
jgi:hypothetical protein